MNAYNLSKISKCYPKLPILPNFAKKITNFSIFHRYTLFWLIDLKCSRNIYFYIEKIQNIKVTKNIRLNKNCITNIIKYPKILPNRGTSLSIRTFGLF